MITQEWQKKHLKEIKERAGPRYCPELNINLPISEVFDWLCRTESFYTTIRKEKGELLNDFKRITSNYEKDNLQDKYKSVNNKFYNFISVVDRIKDYNVENIPWREISKKSKNLNDSLWDFLDNLREEKDLLKGAKAPSEKASRYNQSRFDKYNSDIHHVYKIQDTIRYFEKSSLSNKAKLSNDPFLLLTGSAGTGKTHLLCDVTKHRLKNNLPTFMVFGEYFSNESDFWFQFFSQMQFGETITKEDFLTKINNLGKITNSRSLIIIDALNENISHAPNFWKQNLTNIVEDIKKYPHVALVVSIRNGFEGKVFTEKQKSFFIQEEHYGFRFKEWEAVNKFFQEFDLPLPEVPLLMPEFQNPLFLLLFCSAFSTKKINLHKKSDRELKKLKRKETKFRGTEGATYVFELFVLNATATIAQKFKITKGKFKTPAYRIWSEVIKIIASKMVDKNDDRISEEELISIINKAYPDINVGEFIQELESNILIVKVPNIDFKQTDKFDIRFPFQKFSDHLIGRYIFQKYEEEFGKRNKGYTTAKKFFSKRRKLGKFLSTYGDRGLIEALSIQCPEQLKGTEFIEVAPYLQKDLYLSQIANDSFIESLIWRNPKAFSKDQKNTLKIINTNIIRTPIGHRKLLEALLTVAPIPGHPFNANLLHKHLFKFSLPERDSWWSTFLHYQYGEQGAVDRLLEWSWSTQHKNHLSDESVFLVSIALSWFLTTSNRFVRDKATKGLVCLLQNRINLLPELLKMFKEANDPYVSERLYAVAYGCVLRNKEDKEDLEILAGWIYENIFSNNKPPIHILLRDYARGVIEVALKRGIELKINEKNINPPYKSIWPTKIPTNEELENKYLKDSSGKGKSNLGLSIIWSSVNLGDFARYVIGTNFSSTFEWSGRRISSSDSNRRKIYENFKKQLSKEQSDLLNLAVNPFFGIDQTEIHKYIKIVGFEEKEKLSYAETKKQEKDRELEQQNRFLDFENSLSEKQKKIFKKEIKPYLDGHGKIKDPLETFDLKIAQRWICNRIINLGYDAELHGEFDRYVNSNILDRREHKAERIGKKYQWIAYHEFMALISDHFELKNDIGDQAKKEYKGPWYPRIRDIDPSFVLQNDDHIKNTVNFSNWKSNQGDYNAWKLKKSDLAWLQSNTDLPDPEKIIPIIDDKQKEWLILEGSLDWEEKTPPEHKKYDIPVRQIWYMVKSYIVKRKDAVKFFNWAKKQNFMGSWMPESGNLSEIFLGEYPNSIAFEDLRYDYNIWEEPEEIDVPIVVTYDSYLNEFTLDCSFDRSVSIRLPCKWIVNNLKLNHKFLDGNFYDKQENLITIDTSIFEENLPSALLVNKKTLIEFLDKNDFSIIWTLSGEKRLIGGDLFEKHFTGTLIISGAYTLKTDEDIIGKTNSKFTK